MHDIRSRREDASSVSEQRGSLNIPDTDRPRGRKRTEKEGKRKRDREWSRVSSFIQYRSLYATGTGLFADREPLNIHTLVNFTYVYKIQYIIVRVCVQV